MRGPKRSVSFSAGYQRANENPAQGMGFGRRLSGVPKSLGGTFIAGCIRLS